MVFNKETKQAFLQPTKTATQTTRHFCKGLGWRETHEAHVFTKDLIEKYPNLNNYKIYGFLRDPLARFESCVLFLKNVNPGKFYFESVLHDNGFKGPADNLSYEDVINLLFKTKHAFNNFFAPQSAWLDHPKVTVLDFDNFESELRRIVGNYSEPVEKLNSSDNFVRGEVTQKVLDFVRQEYAIDYALAKDKLGKEYLP